MAPKGRKRSASLLDALEEEEIVADSQPELLNSEETDSSTDQEWGPKKRKRRKIGAAFKARARERTTLQHTFR